MNNNDFKSKIYKDFSEFIAEASGREIEYLILDSKFTSSFNYRIKELLKELAKEGRRGAELLIIFNTEGEIAIIDKFIVGKYISNNYLMHMENYYKENLLNKIVKNVVNGSEKTQRDFIFLSFNILYEVLMEIFMETKCKREVLSEYSEQYSLSNYQGEYSSMLIASILIVEDISKYLRIGDCVIKDSIKLIIKKKFSQNS